ncbi:hypothetical protein HK101_001875 [Irineochytrium annulatum]|nr:hypothetical protein HK101_001875 [Irineochytrium annulatum]
MPSAPVPPSYAYATLITRDSYYRAAAVLARSLHAAGSLYPLVIMHPGGAGVSIETLEALQKEPGVLLKKVEYLSPKLSEGHPSKMVFARFADVWTKVEVWGLYEYELVCFLDADMLVLQNMDDVFHSLADDPSASLAAVPACVCNPHKIKTYPPSWIPSNCAHTHEGMRRRGVAEDAAAPAPPRYFNSGLLVLRPGRERHAFLKQQLLENGDSLAGYQFPDQDWLNDLHKDFIALPYIYNALKTLMKYHKDVWDLKEVKNVHYILEKPWDVRDGDYAELNEYWWNVWDGKPWAGM